MRETLWDDFYAGGGVQDIESCLDAILTEMEKPSAAAIHAVREDLRVDYLDPTMDEARMAFVAGIRAIKEGK